MRLQKLKPIKVKSLEMTHFGRPTRWLGETINGDTIIISENYCLLGYGIGLNKIIADKNFQIYATILPEDRDENFCLKLDVALNELMIKVIGNH